MAKKKDSKKKPAPPTHADAELVLKLYDLRREPELRRARQFVMSEFWPQNADDYLAILSEFGTQRNAWYRQATSYWEMAASLVVRGVVNREIFVDWSSEMWMIYGKALPYLKEVRERSGMPGCMVTWKRSSRVPRVMSTDWQACKNGSATLEKGRQRQRPPRAPRSILYFR